MGGHGPKLHFRTFVHATEDPDRVARALLYAMGAADEPEGPSRLEPTRLKGHHGNDITVLEAKLGKARDVLRCLHQLGRDAPDALEELRAQSDDRLDADQGTFRFRLDKQAAVRGRIALTGSGDAIQVELRIPRLPGTDLAEEARRIFTARPTNV